MRDSIRAAGLALAAGSFVLLGLVWFEVRRSREDIHHIGPRIMEPGHRLSTVVQTAEGPTTVVSEGSNMPALLRAHKEAIADAKGL